MIYLMTFESNISIYTLFILVQKFCTMGGLPIVSNSNHSGYSVVFRLSSRSPFDLLVSLLLLWTKNTSSYWSRLATKAFHTTIHSFHCTADHQWLADFFLPVSSGRYNRPWDPIPEFEKKYYYFLQKSFL